MFDAAANVARHSAVRETTVSIHGSTTSSNWPDTLSAQIMCAAAALLSVLFSRTQRTALSWWSARSMACGRTVLKGLIVVGIAQAEDRVAHVGKVATRFLFLSRTNRLAFSGASPLPMVEQTKIMPRGMLLMITAVTVPVNGTTCGGGSCQSSFAADCNC
jgi:hypothetical protein